MGKNIMLSRIKLRLGNIYLRIVSKVDELALIAMFATLCIVALSIYGWLVIVPVVLFSGFLIAVYSVND